MTLGDAASKYVQSIAAAMAAGVAAEPEAQLTVPVHDLFVSVAQSQNMGSLELLREAQLSGVRPDFAALVNKSACGWIELKAPGHSLDGSQWRGRERTQWQRLSELDSLIVTNGEKAYLYQLGEIIDTADLPTEPTSEWDSQGLSDLLRKFVSMRPPVITKVAQLADRLAPLARMLRQRLSAGLAPGSANAAIMQAKKVWSAHVHENADDAQFASDLAQVVSYSLAIAALRGGADKNRDNRISLEEARDALKSSNAVLAASLGPVLEVKGLYAAVAAEIGAIERLVSVVDNRTIAKSKDSRGEPWLWFYEDFLAKYDPAARQQAGVYYTPTAVVRMQVDHVDYILRNVLKKRPGFADKNVVTLDPATGSGTYPLAVIDRAAEVALAERGPAGPRQASKHLVSNLLAFELLPGPYAVAHLRIGQRLAELSGAMLPEGNVRVYLTDTLDDPAGVPAPATLWGDMEVLAQERERARTVKSDQPVTVCLGNPPYFRGTAADGKWVVNPGKGRSLFLDVIEPAQRAGIIFSAQASLYNDYVYFWRWAIWKAFEQRPDEPAVVSFITASSWLNGPAFVGLRDLARKYADEMWIVDLGGEGRGANEDENVFAIQTPVAIVTLFRRGGTTATPAVVKYRKIAGTRAEKLTQVLSTKNPLEDPDGWSTHDDSQGSSLIPAFSGDAWLALPLMTDLFPWQQPGSKYGRTWPIAPEPELIEKRWALLLSKTDESERAAYFVTGTSGRNIHTKVAGYTKKLSELLPGSRPEPIARYGFRSFDRQWALEDRRLAKTDSPSLWRSRSDKQIFIASSFTTPLGDGPALTVTADVPDLHFFNGRGGKDIMPLYRDGSATMPNVTQGLLDVLGDKLGIPLEPEDLAAYSFALLAHAGYRKFFEEELVTAGARVPITADPALFGEVVQVGKKLLWLQTYAERFQDDSAARTSTLPAVPGLQWDCDIEDVPEDLSQVSYDKEAQTLTVGTGRLAGVAPEVWEFSVGRWQVLKKWLAFRTRKGSGLAATKPQPLDVVRPEAWNDDWNGELLDLVKVLTHTVRLASVQDQLLQRVVAGSLITADVLPVPQPSERAEPK
ncbi:type ISP restriction/modification enzyme [Pseudarthrobacter sulfonivorans]|uniref:type ISP restriction/modification enzyme n=1 Tax=Pseudarthrobacter sulfonivorans TaxID=121292 RepID=UPI0021060F2A|nr:type ISP restriction/modification enzyme [Pseudarthrobacter sulfonivorans]